MSPRPTVRTANTPTLRTRNAARRLVDALEAAAELDIEVLSAQAGQGTCLLIVETAGDGERLAIALEAMPARFGWTTGPADAPVWADPAENTTVVIEVRGRAELHPRARRDSNAQPSEYPPSGYFAV